MILPRRRILHQAASVATLLAVPHIARAQTYPARPVHLLVGYPPGGPVDIAARLIGGYLSERLGQTFVIENRAGTGSNLATEAVVRAQPDGYTLLATAPPNIINATLYPNLSFNFIRDIAPVAGLVRVPNVMEVNPSFPAKTVPEFIIYAKSNPVRSNFASAGIGASQHVAAELFKLMTGVAMQHVPYRRAAPRPRWPI
jgi:tripartite-type tricarboxylate transporter receptor subunit TctC